MQEKLYRELSDLDLEEVTEYFHRTVSTLNEATELLDDKMEPLDPSQCGSVLRTTPAEAEQYRRLSYERIAGGKLAILLLAGGQGTRLGVRRSAIQ